MRSRPSVDPDLLKSAPGRSVLSVMADADAGEWLREMLADAGLDVTMSLDVEEGLFNALQKDVDAFLIDAELPNVGGMALCRRLRTIERYAYTPVLMLTAKDGEQERIQGLQTGADDYVTKPFCLPELLARVNAIFRRCDAFQADDAPLNRIERYRDLRIDLGAREVRVGEQTAALTAREFDLLVHFVRHPERVYSRAQLLDQVWGHGHQGYEHTVNSHINRLRAKLERDPGNPRYIRTVWGVGYCLSEAEPAALARA